MFKIQIVESAEDAPKAIKIKYARHVHEITREMMDALEGGKMLTFDSGDAAEYIVMEGCNHD